MTIKRDLEMFHHESWKPIYFGVKMSKVKVTRHKKTVPACVLALLLVLVSSGFIRVLFYRAIVVCRFNTVLEY